MCVVREGVCMSRCVDGRPHPLTPLTSDPKLNAPAACFVDMDVQQHRRRTAALQRPAGVAQPMSTPPGGRDLGELSSGGRTKIGPPVSPGGTRALVRPAASRPWRRGGAAGASGEVLLRHWGTATAAAASACWVPAAPPPVPVPQGPLRHGIDEERVDAIIIVFVFMSARGSLRRLAVQHQHRRCKKPPPHGTL